MIARSVTLGIGDAVPLFEVKAAGGPNILAIKVGKAVFARLFRLSQALEAESGIEP